MPPNPTHATDTRTDPARWDDTVLPFQLDGADVRGRVARLDTALDRVLEQHNYPPAVSHQVAEAATLTALIGQTIKLRWKLSLQIRGDGPLRLIATDYFAPQSEAEPARLRAYASFDPDHDLSAADGGFPLIGKGMFAILIDQGQGTAPYQGITPIAGGSLAACAETYFAQSEQLPTRFKTLATRADSGAGPRWRAGGIMIQHMPKASPFARDGGSGEGGLLMAQDLVDGDDAENWNRAVILMEAAEETELIGPHVGQRTLLRRLFHAETPRVFPAQPVQFGCTCSAEKVRQTMSIYSAKDVAHMTTEDGVVTADCQFCGAHYELDPKTLGFEATDAG
ncbi:MAG: Hsp33 family molecular chaperone HslO [Pseudomonadota bacterium]